MFAQILTGSWKGILFSSFCALSVWLNLSLLLHLDISVNLEVMVMFKIASVCWLVVGTTLLGCVPAKECRQQR